MSVQKNTFQQKLHHIQTRKPEKVDWLLHGVSPYQKTLSKRQQIKSNNTNNIFINQLLRLPMLKHTQKK